MTSYSSVRLRPSVFGLLALAALPSVALIRPSANDPDLAALGFIASCAALALGFIWPVISIRLVRVDGVGPIADCDAGSVASVPIHLSGQTAGLELSASGRESGWYRAVPPVVTRMGIRPVRRGVRAEFRVMMRTAVPFGFLTASRDVTVPLDRPWHVGPAPTPAREQARPRSAETAQANASPTSGGDSIRSVRAYVPGDPAHLVHWPTTARTGYPMMRELENPDTEQVVIVVDLGLGATSGEVVYSDEAVESAVRRADGLARQALRTGVYVTLITAEGATAVTAWCRDTDALRRRLAAATPGRIALPANGRAPVEVVTP